MINAYYKSGMEKAAKDVGSVNPHIIAILHGAPVPLTSLGGMLYEGFTSPDKHYIRRPLITGLGSILGDTAGRLLMQAIPGLGGTLEQQAARQMLGGVVGRYLGALGAQYAQNEE